MQDARRKKRKRRRINNGLIDVDSVSISAGPEYANWIAVSKEKLKERESKLIELRIEQIQSIVNQAIVELEIVMEINGDTFEVDEDIIENAENFLFSIIEKWNGIQTGRTKRTMEEFRDYFKLSKHWFDQIKKTVFGTVFWLHLFRFLHEIMVEQQDLDADGKKMKFMTVLYRLFNGSIKYSNTKRQPLINGECLLNSDELHEYLSSLHPSLAIKQWIKSQSSAKRSSSRYHCNTSIIMERVRHQMFTIISTPTAPHSEPVHTHNDVVADDNNTVVIKPEAPPVSVSNIDQSTTGSNDVSDNAPAAVLGHSNSNQNSKIREEQTANVLARNMGNVVDNARLIESTSFDEACIGSLLRVLEQNMCNTNHNNNHNHNNMQLSGMNSNNVTSARTNPQNFAHQNANQPVSSVANQQLAPITQSLLSAFSHGNPTTNSNPPSTTMSNNNARPMGVVPSQHAPAPIIPAAASMGAYNPYSNLVLPCPSHAHGYGHAAHCHCGGIQQQCGNMIPMAATSAAVTCTHGNCLCNHNFPAYGHQHSPINNMNHMRYPAMSPMVIHAHRLCINMCDGAPPAHIVSGYQGQHGPTYRVNDVRYSPFGGFHLGPPRM